jgi:hypothetical protein
MMQQTRIGLAFNCLLARAMLAAFPRLWILLLGRRLWQLSGRMAHRTWPAFDRAVKAGFLGIEFVACNAEA